MQKSFAAVSLAVLFTLATRTTALAEEKVAGVVTKIELAADGNAAVATLKDSKNGQTVDITVQDKTTLDKLKDRWISPGDEIKCKYEKQSTKNVATSFEKPPGCGC